MELVAGITKRSFTAVNTLERATFSAVDNPANTLTISFSLLLDCLFPELLELDVSKEIAVLGVDSLTDLLCRSHRRTVVHCHRAPLLKNLR